MVFRLHAVKSVNIAFLRLLPSSDHRASDRRGSNRCVLCCVVQVIARATQAGVLLNTRANGRAAQTHRQLRARLLRGAQRAADARAAPGKQAGRQARMRAPVSRPRSPAARCWPAQHPAKRKRPGAVAPAAISSSLRRTHALLRFTRCHTHTHARR